MIRKIVYLMGFSLVLGGCTVMTPKVERLSSEDGEIKEWSGEGVLYALPKKQFTVTFDVSKTVFGEKDCEPDDAATQILGIDKLPEEGETIYAINATTITTQAVPDNSKILLSRMPESDWFADSSLTVNLNEFGLVEGIDGTTASKSVQVAGKLLELGGAIGSSAILFGVSDDARGETDKCVVRLADYKELKDRLQTYRGGNIPHFKDTIELVSEELKAEQAKIKALFMNNPKVTKGKLSCQLSPIKAGEIGILDFSASEGFKVKRGVQCQGDNQFFARGKLSKIQTVSLVTEETNRTLLTAANKNNTNLEDEAGFFYNVPVQAMAWLKGHDKASTDPVLHMIPQFGKVRSLPRVEGSSPALVVNLHPETGALKSVKVAHNSADYPGLIGSINTSSSAVLAALKTKKDSEEAAEAEAAAKETEMALLTYKKELLETQLAIKLAEEALNQ